MRLDLQNTHVNAIYQWNELCQRKQTKEHWCPPGRVLKIETRYKGGWIFNVFTFSRPSTVDVGRLVSENGYQVRRTVRSKRIESIGRREEVITGSSETYRFREFEYQIQSVQLDSSMLDDDWMIGD